MAPAIFDLDRFLEQARTTYAVLWQDKLWYPKDRNPVAIAEMDPAWRHNTANWLLRRAEYFALHGSYGMAASVPSPEHMGVMAYEALDADVTRSGLEAAEDPEGWVKATPLYRALAQGLPETAAELAKHWSTCAVRTGGGACTCRERHLTECPKREDIDADCTCRDYSPEWTLS